MGTVLNSTDGVVISSGNFTQTNCNLAFSSGDINFNNTDWDVTYTCTFGGESFTSTNTSLVGLGDFADFIPIIVIALAASIIIGLILLGFAFGRRER